MLAEGLGVGIIRSPTHASAVAWAADPARVLVVAAVVARALAAVAAIESVRLFVSSGFTLFDGLGRWT